MTPVDNSCSTIFVWCLTINVTLLISRYVKSSRRLLLRGNYCFELILDDERNLSNFVAVDPDLFKFLGRDDPVDGTVYDLIQYDAEAKASGDRLAVGIL